MRTLLYVLLLPSVCFLPAASSAQECIDYAEIPLIVGGVDGLGPAQDVALAGHYAYVAGGNSNLWVIDIANPSSPVMVGNVNTLGIPSGVEVAGTLAYVSAGAVGLQVVDISNPASPVIIGGVDTPGSALGVALSGTHAYVADDVMGLQVVDISNPASPAIVGFADTPGRSRGVAVAGDLVYIADSFASAPSLSYLKVFNISNPTSPTLVGELARPSGEVFGVAVDGNHAYLTYGFAGSPNLAGIDVVDISNLAALVLVGNLGIPIEVARTVTLAGTHAYIGATKVWIADISDPTTPALIASVDTPPGVRGVAVAGAHAYVTCTTGLRVVEALSNPVSPFVGQINLVYGHTVATSGNFAYLAGGFFELRVVDISNPETPVLVWELQNGDGRTRDVAVAGNYAYSIGHARFMAFNISNPANPSWASANVVGRDVAASGNHAYVTGDDGLKVIDASSPPSFPIVAIVDPPGGIWDVAVQGNRLYYLLDVSGPNMALVTMDITDPSAPSELGSVQFPNTSAGNTGVTVAGSYVYVANDNIGLHVIDVSDPSAPIIVETIDTPGFATASAVAGDVVYIADSLGGLQVADVSVPTDPQILGRYNGECGSVAVSGDFVVVSGEGLITTTVLHTQCPATTGVPDPATSPDIVRMATNIPNPFSESTIIPYELPAAGAVSIRVYDISGRLVHVLTENARRGPGKHSVTWNGLDARGRRLPAGVYLCRLEAAGRTETRRLTLLR